ncbi:MAG: DUF2141 domain-containing protein [Bacteroidota bacterium]
MKKTILTSFIALIFFAFTSEQTSSITVKVSNIEKVEGPIYFMLYKSKDGFPSDQTKAYRQGKVTHYGTEATFTFDNLPVGEYAVAFFQDENNNGKLDSNFLGIPKESVGASNMTGFSKPSFRKSKFQLGQEQIILELEFVI